jgi:hypothetical protein
MRGSVAFVLLCLLATGCATTPTISDAELSFRSDRQYGVRYFDRNGDGRADFAFYHIPDSDDMDWALVDTRFSGRFDVAIHYGITVGEYHMVHPTPVPERVRVQRGQLPVIYP